MEGKRRSIFKTMSWRATATLTTIVLVYVFTGEMKIAFEVGLIEFGAKLCLFYMHERMWNTINWGRKITVN